MTQVILAAAGVGFVVRPFWVPTAASVASTAPPPAGFPSTGEADSLRPARSTPSLSLRTRLPSALITPNPGETSRTDESVGTGVRETILEVPDTCPIRSAVRVSVGRGPVVERVADSGRKASAGAPAEARALPLSSRMAKADAGATARAASTASSGRSG